MSSNEYYYETGLCRATIINQASVDRDETFILYLALKTVTNNTEKHKRV